MDVTKGNGIAALAAKLCLTAALAIGAANIVLVGQDGHDGGKDEDKNKDKDKVLYIWASDQAHVAPDFLAVVDFDEDSSNMAR